LIKDSPSTASKAPAVALTPRQQFWATFAIFTALIIATLEMTLVNIALPLIAVDLGVTEAEAIWVVNVFQIGMVATMLPLAALGEIIGLQRITLIGLVIFTLAAVICTFSTTLPVLLAGRALQAFGAACIVSVNGALLQHVYPASKLGRAFGLNALVVSAAVSAAPTVAAAVLAVGPWSWLFAINVPIGIAAFVMAWTSLPSVPRASHRFDALSAVLSGLAVGLVVTGISIASRQAHPAVVAGCIGSGLLFGWLMIKRQAGHPAPVLPVDLFRIPMFALTSATAACAFCAQGIALVALPFFLQDVMHRSQVETGLLLTPWPVLVAIMGPIAGRLAERYSAGVLGSIGLALFAAGLASLAMLDAQSTNMDSIWRLALCGLGFGFFQAPNLRTMMMSAPSSRGGSASGIIATSRLVGQAIGAALVALSFIIAGPGGATLAFLLGVGFAMLGVVMSVSRLMVQPGR
jgi:MFS transporter, DHA2 family, multidrug resistance protein